MPPRKRKQQDEESQEDKPRLKRSKKSSSQNEPPKRPTFDQILPGEIRNLVWMFAPRPRRVVWMASDDHQPANIAQNTIYRSRPILLGPPGSLDTILNIHLVNRESRGNALLYHTRRSFALQTGSTGQTPAQHRRNIRVDFDFDQDILFLNDRGDVDSFIGGPAGSLNQQTDRQALEDRNAGIRYVMVGMERLGTNAATMVLNDRVTRVLSTFPNLEILYIPWHRARTEDDEAEERRNFNNVWRLAQNWDLWTRPPPRVVYLGPREMYELTGLRLRRQTREWEFVDQLGKDPTPSRSPTPELPETVNGG